MPFWRDRPPREDLARKNQSPLSQVFPGRGEYRFVARNGSLGTLGRLWHRCSFSSYRDPLIHWVATTAMNRRHWRNGKSHLAEEAIGLAMNAGADVNAIESSRSTYLDWVIVASDTRGIEILRAHAALRFVELLQRTGKRPADCVLVWAGILNRNGLNGFVSGGSDECEAWKSCGGGPALARAVRSVSKAGVLDHRIQLSRGTRPPLNHRSGSCRCHGFS
jgi:hypothetical protein